MNYNNELNVSHFIVCIVFVSACTKKTFGHQQRAKGIFFSKVSKFTPHSQLPVANMTLDTNQVLSLCE